MAKSKNKVGISSNFENLKAQMMKKKELAESLELENSIEEEKNAKSSAYDKEHMESMNNIKEFLSNDSSLHKEPTRNVQDKEVLAVSQDHHDNNDAKTTNTKKQSSNAKKKDAYKGSSKQNLNLEANSSESAGNEKVIMKESEDILKLGEKVVFHEEIEEESVNVPENVEVHSKVKEDTYLNDMNENNTDEDSMDEENYEDEYILNEKTAVSSRSRENKDVNVNKIVIRKVEKQEAPKRITYYLKPETIKKIDRFSRMAGMGKSEFVQTLLEEVLNNLEIEK